MHKPLHRENRARTHARYLVYSPGRAYLERSRRAIHAAGGHTLLIEQIASQVRNIIDASGATLKALGGWTEIIDRAIGEQPDPRSNELGFTTNPDWYVHEFFVAHKLDIRNRAIALGRNE